MSLHFSGHVTRQDYETVLVPAVDAALKAHRKIRLFYKVAPDFAGIEPGAVLEDIGVGMAHLLAWERVAVVTDVAWIGHTIKAFGFLMPAAVRVFPLSDEGAARAWIAGA